MYSDQVTRSILTEDNLRQLVRNMFLDEHGAELFNYIVRRYDGLSEFTFNVLCNCCPGFYTDDFSGTDADIFNNEIERLLESEHVIHCSETMFIDMEELNSQLVEVETVMNDIGFPYFGEEISYTIMMTLRTYLSNVINLIAPIRCEYSKFCFVLIYGGIMCLSTAG